MENRSRRHEISLLDPIETEDPSSPPSPRFQLPALATPCAVAGLVPWSGATRPLSDIRELSEPSIVDEIARNPNGIPRHHRSTSGSGSIKAKRSVRRVSSERDIKPVAEAQHVQAGSRENGSSSYSTTPEQANIYSVPHSSVPQRSSSWTRTQRPGMVTLGNSRHLPSSKLNPPALEHAHQNRGPGYPAPKRGVPGLDRPSLRERPRATPRTYVRDSQPTDILAYPCFKHPRVKLDMQISAPLFVGGGSVAGYVRLVVDGNDHLKRRRSLSIGAVSVDLLGFEDVADNRRAPFLALGTDLIDANHPPPPELIEADHPLYTDGEFWPLGPSSAALPFTITLPLNTGPPPFQSKHACIRFLLAATAALRDMGKIYPVRASREVHILPTYDPEKALTSLRSPLTASDEVVLRQGIGRETVQLKASLHRQVWVSGSNIFVDVSISNRSRRAVKRLELALERDILLYKHTAAATLEKSASQARIFESNEQTMLIKTTFKPGALQWDGIDPHSSDLRTYELALPRGHGTVRCGKYFEVRYFLNVTAAVSGSKQVSVQLPIILIHINSLDVVPNSIAQVAAAIEEKRADLQRKRSRSRRAGGKLLRQRSGSSSLGADLRRRPSYGQGRAFAAPRQQSLDRLRDQEADMDELRCVLDSSPRKNSRSCTDRRAFRQPASELNLNSLAARQQDLDDPAEVGMDLRPKPSYSGRGDGDQSLRSRLRGMRSLETFRYKGFMGKGAMHESNVQATTGRSASQQSTHRIMPHTLGLSGPGGGEHHTRTRFASPIERTSSRASAHEASDRGGFDIKSVSRKASGGLREKGINWIERRRSHRNQARDREKENWI